MPATLYADSREKRSGIAIRLRQLGLTVRTRQLSVGDYALPGKFVVERKEANAFATSIMSGHLFQQAELLAGHQDRAIIVLKGRADEIDSSITSESVVGALSALLLFYDIAVTPSPSPDYTARLIGRLVRHSLDGLGYEIPTRTDKPQYDAHEMVFRSLQGERPGQNRHGVIKKTLRRSNEQFFSWRGRKAVAPCCRLTGRRRGFQYCLDPGSGWFHQWCDIRFVGTGTGIGVCSYPGDLHSPG